MVALVVADAVTVVVFEPGLDPPPVPVPAVCVPEPPAAVVPAGPAGHPPVPGVVADAAVALACAAPEESAVSPPSGTEDAPYVLFVPAEETKGSGPFPCSGCFDEQPEKPAVSARKTERARRRVPCLLKKKKRCSVRLFFLFCMRLIPFARCAGDRTVCGREIKQQTVDQIVDRIMELPERTRIQILAPVVRGRKGEYVKEFESARKSGYVRVRVDGIVYDLSESIKLEKNKKHTIEIVIDRLVIGEEIRSRLADSIETAPPC